MRSTHVFIPLALAAGLAFVAVPAGAQATCTVPDGGGTCTVDQNLTTNVPYTVQLDVHEFPDVDLLSGDLPTATTTLTVTSNVAWSLTIQAASATWSGGAGTKPAGDLRWAAAEAPAGPDPLSLTPMLTTPAPIAASEPAGTKDYTVLYRSSWSVTDPPDAYSLTVTYTVTAP